MTKENLEEEVLKARGYVLVDFYGDGCIPCAVLTPYIHRFEEVYGTTVRFCPLNTTKARRLTTAQEVLGLPVIATYKDREMIDSRIKDDATSESYEKMLKKYARYSGVAGGPVQAMHSHRRG